VRGSEEGGCRAAHPPSLPGPPAQRGRERAGRKEAGVAERGCEEVGSAMGEGGGARRRGEQRGRKR